MKTTKEMIEIMKAYEEGKQIECNNRLNSNEVWESMANPIWDWSCYDYRVKEESKYRPYKDIDEMINDFCKRSGAKRSKMGEPFIWVKDKEGIKRLVTAYDERINVVMITSWISPVELFNKYTYLDGSPCGIKE